MAPHPTSDIDTAWFLLLFGALAVAVTGVAVVLSLRTRERAVALPAS